MKYLTFVIAFFIYSTNHTLSEKPASVDFFYFKYGEPLDATYEPCLCRNSIWNEVHDSLKINQKKEVEIFAKYFRSAKHKKTVTFMNFSNAAILTFGNKVDTIYFDSQFSVFTRKKIVLNETERLNYKDYECYKIDKKASEIFPVKFIAEYEKNGNKFEKK